MMRIAAVAALFAGAMGQEAPGKIEATCEFTATSQTVEGGGITSGTMYITYVPGVGATTDVMTTGMTPGLPGIRLLAANACPGSFGQCTVSLWLSKSKIGAQQNGFGVLQQNPLAQGAEPPPGGTPGCKRRPSWRMRTGMRAHLRRVAS